MRWGLCIAGVAGALALGAAKPPSADNQRQQPSNAQSAPISVTVTQPAAEKDAGCEDGQDKRSSDLCAQWEAVDAARKAALYSLLGMVAAIVSAAFLFLTLRLGRNVARAELRPYMLVDEASAATSGSVEAHLCLRNFGNTPAFDVQALRFCGLQKNSQSIRDSTGTNPQFGSRGLTLDPPFRSSPTRTPGSPPTAICILLVKSGSATASMTDGRTTLL